MAKKEPELLTDAELCSIFRITKVTLRTHLKNNEYVGRIKHLRVGGQRRWSRKAVEAFINGKQG